MTTQITEHFTLEDAERSNYAATHNIDNHLPDNLLPNIKNLFEHIEIVRKVLGDHYGIEVFIIPSSVYRCDKLNSLIGGVETSQHRLGQAMDFHCSYRDPKTKKIVQIDVREIFGVILHADLKFDQLILEHDKNNNIWVHYSVPDIGSPYRMEILAGKKGERLNRVSDINNIS